ncbi:Abi family protein [Lacticaseibacillus paracasei]|uniref:Abi family protein n=1 Tax=Lacticaseibacillus paracasei TaxID=1597 RepID=UPI002ADEAD7D|nr:Abi family protein [Lacticaseibacillus paracasei]MEA0974434.1 Abi family protein [Lacticaseibacillus paracasei]
MSYNRKATNYKEQINILKQRGLTIRDDHAAESILKSIGYFRFKGYCLTSYGPIKETFRPGITIDQIYRIYQFDSDIRALTMKACQRAEVRFKSIMGMELALKYGPVLPKMGFYEANSFIEWKKRTKDAHDQGSARSEMYVHNYRDNYHEWPIWVDLELSTFGNVSKLYTWLKTPMKKTIAADYGVNHKYIKNWAHILTVSRNTCAHNSRFYGRLLSLGVLVPTKYQSFFGMNTYFSITFVLFKMLEHKDFASYLHGLHAISKKYGNEVDWQQLGFQTQWYDYFLRMF